MSDCDRADIIPLHVTGTVDTDLSKLTANEMMVWGLICGMRAVREVIVCDIVVIQPMISVVQEIVELMILHQNWTPTTVTSSRRLSPVYFHLGAGV